MFERSNRRVWTRGTLRKFCIFLDNTSQEKGLIDEVIRFSRLREEYSQEELSDGICSPETISRIELGKDSPTIKKFYAIMDKLGLGVGYYNTEFVVKRFETLQKAEKLKRLNFLKEYGEAEKILEEIAKEVDVSENQQLIELYHIVFDYRLGRITLEEALEQTEELMELSLKKENGKFKIPSQISSVEISLLNQIAIYYKKSDRKDEAKEILTLLYEYFHQSKLEAPERSQKYFTIVSNLALILEEMGQLKKAIEFWNEFLKANINYNRGMRLGYGLIAKAYNQERVNDADFIETYKTGYYLCVLFEDFRNQNIVMNYVLENLQIKFEI